MGMGHWHTLNTHKHTHTIHRNRNETREGIIREVAPKGQGNICPVCVCVCDMLSPGLCTISLHECVLLVAFCTSSPICGMTNSLCAHPTCEWIHMWVYADV